MILNLVLPLIILVMASSYELKKNNDQLKETEMIIHQVFDDDGIFPNNKFPVLVYKDLGKLTAVEEASNIEKIFMKNGWGNSWRNGIYDFHHYHSTAHEVLGVYSGSANVLLGGEKNGEKFYLEKGDVIIIPAGVAHKLIESSEDFAVVGAYPEGQSWDMNYGKEGERPAVDQNIKNVPYPEMDPVFGETGPLTKMWTRRNK